MTDDPNEQLNPEDEQPQEPNPNPEGENLEQTDPEAEQEEEWSDDYEDDYEEDYEDYEEEDEYDEEQARLDAENEASMRKLQELFEELQEIIDSLPKDVRIFELPIVEKELWAFRDILSATVEARTPLDPDELYDQFDDFVPIQPLEETKTILVHIAMLGDVEAYRFLEKFESVAEPDLKGWARVGLMQCKIYLENSLRDEPIMLLGFGLSGQGHRIRHLCYLSEFEPLQEGESRFVAQELEAFLSKEDAVIEWLERRGDHFAMSLLLTHRRIAQQCMEEFLESCEFFDGFLWVTNVSQPSDEEVQNWIKTNREEYQRSLLQNLSDEPNDADPSSEPTE